MRIILLTVAVITFAGCSSTPKASRTISTQTSSDIPRKMTPIILTPQERASRDAELSNRDVAQTAVEGNLVR